MAADKAAAHKPQITIHKSRPANHQSPVTPLYIFDAIKVIKSRQRLEYPHSLSYQASTLAQFVPTTRVYSESTIEEWGLLRKSMETSSSSVYSRIFFIGPSAAALSAAFTELTVTGLSVNTVRSTTLTLGVGTRME